MTNELSGLVTEVSSGIGEMPATHLDPGFRVALWPNLLSVKSGWLSSPTGPPESHV